MPTLAVALAPFFWMTCCVLGERRDLLTVQGLPVKELELMTSVQMVMVKMLVLDVPHVSTTKHNANIEMTVSPSLGNYVTCTPGNAHYSLQ